MTTTIARKMESWEGVHVTHCCAEHGCCYVYADESCPVTTGRFPQRYPCEVCCDEQEELKRVVTNVPPGVELLNEDNLCEEWNITTQIGAIPLIFYRTGATVINTAPYTVDVLAWIGAKAKLIELKKRWQ